LKGLHVIQTLNLTRRRKEKRRKKWITINWKGEKKGITTRGGKKKDLQKQLPRHGPTCRDTTIAVEQIFGLGIRRRAERISKKAKYTKERRRNTKRKGKI